MQTTLFRSSVSTRYSGDEKKLRGGYYTPPPIARLLARWAVSDDATVLEPSCGEGEIVEAAAQRATRGNVVAVELFADEAVIARSRGAGRTVVHTGDFFEWFADKMPLGEFDAAVGNPPFLRFHTFPEEHRERAFELMRHEGLSPTRLTNAWVPFVVAATMSLRPGGRLAMVLPAELLQVTYAAELRAYLARKYRRIIIATFRTLLFEDAEQETVLLFGIRDDSGNARMKWIELGGLKDLDEIDRLSAQNGSPVDLNHAREKWTQYYLSHDELELIRTIEQSPAFVPLGTLAEVDVGVVTGRNEFFVVTPADAKRHGISRWCEPMIGRSAQIPGVTLTSGEFEALRASDSRCLLVRLPERPLEQLSVQARDYIALGERNGAHQGYKCRIRLPLWWTVPSVWTPDAFLLRQIHDGPRIVRNAAGVTCTDTIHRLRVRPNVSSAQLAAVSMNSVGFAFAEIRGRSYGGGVLELEPSEAEQLPVPAPPWNLPARLIDGAVRSKNVEEALDLVDHAVMKSSHLDEDKLRMLRSIWRKLYERRSKRRAIRSERGGSLVAEPSRHIV